MRKRFVERQKINLQLLLSLSYWLNYFLGMYVIMFPGNDLLLFSVLHCHNVSMGFGTLIGINKKC